MALLQRFIILALVLVPIAQANNVDIDTAEMLSEPGEENVTGYHSKITDLGNGRFLSVWAESEKGDATVALKIMARLFVPQRGWLDVDTVYGSETGIIGVNLQGVISDHNGNAYVFWQSSTSSSNRCGPYPCRDLYYAKISTDNLSQDYSWSPPQIVVKPVNRMHSIVSGFSKDGSLGMVGYVLEIKNSGYPIGEPRRGRTEIYGIAISDGNVQDPVLLKQVHNTSSLHAIEPLGSDKLIAVWKEKEGFLNTEGGAVTNLRHTLYVGQVSPRGLSQPRLVAATSPDMDPIRRYINEIDVATNAKEDILVTFTSTDSYENSRGYPQNRARLKGVHLSPFGKLSDVQLLENSPADEPQPSNHQTYLTDEGRFITYWNQRCRVDERRFLRNCVYRNISGLNSGLWDRSAKLLGLESRERKNTLTFLGMQKIDSSEEIVFFTDSTPGLPTVVVSGYHHRSKDVGWYGKQVYYPKNLEARRLGSIYPYTFDVAKDSLSGEIMASWSQYTMLPDRASYQTIAGRAIEGGDYFAPFNPDGEVSPRRSAWQNPKQPCDVNGNNKVNGRDALIIANSMAVDKVRDLPPIKPEDEDYYDANGNERVDVGDFEVVAACLRSRGIPVPGVVLPPSNPPIDPPTEETPYEDPQSEEETNNPEENDDDTSNEERGEADGAEDSDENNDSSEDESTNDDSNEEVPLDVLPDDTGPRQSNPWHNPKEPFDVNGDTHISPIDMLITINYRRKHGEGLLPFVKPEKAGAIDVNNDRQITLEDLQLLLEHLNKRP